MASAGRLAPRQEPYWPTGDPSEFDRVTWLERIQEILRPDEGFASLALVLLLAMTMAWSIADAKWILGRDDLTSFLIWVAGGAALWGYLSARLPVPAWVAQALGCLVGAFVVIEMVGATIPNASPGLVGWFNTTAHSVFEAYLDLTWRHQVSTTQFGHFCLVLGILVWGTAQAASYDVFGHHRSVNGVLLMAVVLIANMSLTTNDQFAALVLFSLAALVLLLLAHASDERSSWQRHRIWRGRDFQAPHIQGGMAFACAAVAGALMLTNVASSAPLASAFSDLGVQVQDALGGLSNYLPNGGATRYQPTADFGSSLTINPTFREPTRDVFTAMIPSGADVSHWRLVAYDTFRTTGWTVGTSTQDQIIAGQPLDAGTLDLVDPNAPGRTQVTIAIHIEDSTIRHLVVANEPDSVNTPVQRTLVGVGPDSLDVSSLSTDATDYTVSAYTPDLSPSGAGLTEWRLQHAGTDYPPGLRARYTQGTELVGTQGRALLDEIEAWANGNGNPMADEYDVAKAIQDYLRSDRFTYSTDISAMMPSCQGLSTVDCFAKVREGFCEQYATTMTMLMRVAGYPARYLSGYLPGSVDPHTLIQQVTSQQKHAWVEVYFPSYGWIPFDPTGGGIGLPTELVPGSAVTPGPSQSAEPESSDSAVHPRTSRGGTTGGAIVPMTDNTGPIAILATGMIAVVLLFALAVYWWRRPRRPDRPDSVYRSIVSLASRLGFKPQPTQTVYEYTGMLATHVPTVRDSLGVVAMAAVEVTYGRRQLDSERLSALAAAHQKVRQALLRLVLRMPRLRLRRKGSGRSGHVRG
jgi:transglutaminase-like putative cysteine protease